MVGVRVKEKMTTCARSEGSESGKEKRRLARNGNSRWSVEAHRRGSIVVHGGLLVARGRKKFGIIRFAVPPRLLLTTV
jgi:hypothetical protein